ncbi:hypothetical protein [Methylobacterium radiotolerans]|uniref:Uncharacterized protein n=1 Tax=Methylobacterium radiotolerans (strain ATCC 27329 / DSM 1819 / JCM 2831 / NBRC 15690 / NCIMB 10815 / 0-1) TaxID=426355 RepID=B1M226_METRJ|nr:hypothetical protein [Methylobacterium radiotolerans]ACB24637.1 hypothetical protein Mrad2831_2653 [Methylobacterium radiotolerans JCM 2831]MBE7245323.1 hypothetical protein [Actinomycetospora chiangmaiensis]GEM97090.1 hypothetical protein MRA01_16300 [Methylobacterium radiotolerans]
MAEAEHYDIEEMIEMSVARERRAGEKVASKERREAAAAALRARRAEVEERAALKRMSENPALPTEGGNGGPSLDAPPSFDALERIGMSVFGTHWEGKLGAQAGIEERSIRRFRAGELATTPEAMARARLWAIETAAGLLAAAGEADLAGEVRAREQAMRLRNTERARAVHAANLAKAKAKAKAR